MKRWSIDLRGSSLEADYFKKNVSNMREALKILLGNSEKGFEIDAQMIGLCFSFLDEIEMQELIDNSRVEQDDARARVNQFSNI